MPTTERRPLPCHSPCHRRTSIRIGLIGLGRIGAFHADTLPAIDTVDELVVTDPVAAAVALKEAGESAE